jgi:WD40 repeat protein
VVGCCREAARRDRAWLDEAETGLVREWAAESAADEGSRLAVLLYLDSAFTIAQMIASTLAPGICAQDRESLARRWEATGLLASGSSNPGQEMLAIAGLLLTGKEPRSRPVIMPVVFGLADERGEIGEGSAGLLELRELPGGPAGLFPDPRQVTPASGSGSAFARSLANAWSASPRRCKERCVIWCITLADDPARAPALEGGSLGAAFAVGLLELFRYPSAWRLDLGWLLRAFYGLRPRTAITGVIEDNQRLGHVTGMSAKLGAAHRRKWLVIAPAANRLDRFQAPDPASVRFADTVRQADRHARRWRIGRVVTAAVLAIASAVAGTAAARLASADAGRRQAALQASASLGNYLISQMNSPLASSASTQLVTDALLAVDAYRTAATPQAIQAIFDAYAEISPYQAIIGTPAATAYDGPWPGAGISADRSGTFAVVPHDSAAEVWQVPRDLSARRLIGTIDGVSAAQISPDGTRVGAVSGDGKLQLWTTSPLRLRSQVQLPSDAFDASNGGTILAFDADTRYLAVTGQYSLVIWDLTTGRLKETAVPALADQAIDEIGFLDEAIVYDVQQNGARFFWNPATGDQVPSPRNTERPVLDSPGVTARCVGSRWQFRHTATGQPVAGMPSGIACRGNVSAGALNGHSFVTIQPAGGNNSAQIATIIDLRTGRPVAEAGLPSNARVSGINPAGQRLFVGGVPSGIARLWPPAPSPSTGPLPAVTSPDGRLIAQAAYPGTAPGPHVKILDAKTSKELRTLTMPIGHNLPNTLSDDSVATDAFLANGRLLVLAAGILSLWDAENGTLASPPVMLASAASNAGAGPNQIPPAPTIAADPASGDDEIAVTGPDGTTVETWHATGWRLIQTIGPLPSIVNSIEFSPDGSAIGVTMLNGAAEVFNAADGSVIAMTPAPGGGGSPSLELLRSGYAVIEDFGSIYLWHGSTQIAHITVPAQSIFGLASISADKGSLVTEIIASTSGAALSTPHRFFLPPDPSQWADDICSADGRGLTSQELSIPGPATPDNGC